MRIPALLLVAALCNCSRPAADYGHDLFHDPGLSTAASNPFSCATCHETVEPAIKSLPGYTMHDSAVRESWWGGNVDNLLDSTNQCITNFMRGRALTPDDDKGRALFVYLQTLSPDATAPTLPLTIVQNIVDVPSGDPAAGAAIWKVACGNCHGDPHTGNGRLATTVAIVPDESIQMHGTDPKTGARPIVIEKVRHGKFFNISGNMPPYSLEAMSNDQLGQILGYLEQFGLPTYQGM